MGVNLSEKNPLNGERLTFNHWTNVAHCWQDNGLFKFSKSSRGFGICS